MVNIVVRKDYYLPPNAYRGFTLIELLVVLAIIGTLLSIAAPRYNGRVTTANQAVLKQNLTTLRDSIDKFYGDTGKYPQVLEDLVAKQYLRHVPVDPITGSATTWILIQSSDPDNPGIADVKSGAPGKSNSGQAYQDW
jgi:general secretion pathway protein G